MYSDERSWAGVLMKKVQAISIMIAAAMLFSISACGIPTGSGVPEPVAASNLDVSLLFMNLGLETGDAETETSRTRYLQTFGTYVTYQPESGNWLPVQAAFYYQTGKNKNAQSVSAFMASVKAA